jgi:O-antigen/teichoic acid export membrane protein
MKERKQLTRNVGFALAGELSNMALTFVFGVVAARYLGPERNGVYAYAMSVVWLLLVFTDMGMTTLLTREIARDQAALARELPLVIGLRFVLGLGLTVVAWGISLRAGPSPGAAKALRLMALILILTPLGAYYMVFRAVERMDLSAWVQFISRLVSVLVLLAVSLTALGVYGVIAATLAGTVATAAVVLALLPRIGVAPRVRFAPRQWGVLLGRAFPFLAMSILWEVYNRIDQTLIPYFADMRANGLYAVASRCAFIFTVISTAVNAAVFPYFSRRAVESAAPLRSGLAGLYRYMAVFGLGIAVFIGVPAAGWLVFLFGNAYRPAAPALTVLTAAMPMLFLYSLNVSTLYSCNRQRVVLWITLGSVALDVALDLLLIPRMGFVGAAVATLATNACYFLGTYAAARQALGGLPVARALGAPLICAAAAAGVLHAAAAWPLPLRLAAGLAVFLPLLAATRAVTRDDIILALSLVNRKGDAEA